MKTATLILVLLATTCVFSFFTLNKVQPLVFQYLKTKQSKTNVLVLMNDFVNFETLTDKNGVHVSQLDHITQGRLVLQSVMETAQQSQASILRFLTQKHLEHESLYVANGIIVYDVTLEDVMQLAKREDVLKIVSNEQVDLDFLEQPHGLSNATVDAVEWNIEWINAPYLWEKGINGTGIVIAGSDTGVAYSHPALVSNYRGNLGNGQFNHNYNWYDGARRGSHATCPGGSNTPCDSQGHGTHTIGTMIGGVDRQIGVAPGAKWIACRSIGTETNIGTFLRCLQFFLAPHDLEGKNPNPDLRPHTTGHSYGCRSGSQACDWTAFERSVEALKAAGVMTVASAGNRGPRCNTVTGPPGSLLQTFTVGSLDHKSAKIASYSSRGFVAEYSNRRKPDVSAPGTKVASSIPGNRYAEYSGTSMACPAVNGAVGLLWSAFPSLARDIDRTKKIFEESAIKQPTSECGISGSPNNVYGHGNIDLRKAFEHAQRLLNN